MKKILSGFVICTDFIKKRNYLSLLLVFSFFYAVFSWMYFSVGTLVSSDDHFFHFKFAEVITQHGFLNSFRDFKSIYFSKITQGDYFIYYNFIFYLVLLPFTLIKPLYIAIKLYAVIIAAVSFTIVYSCLKRLKILNPFLWTIFLYGMIGFNYEYRFFLSRPYAFAPALLVLFVYLLHTKKYWGVAIVSFVYLYWHSATFFFPQIVALVYFVFELFYGKKGDKKNLIASFGGVFVGLVSMYLITPGFFIYIKDGVVDIIWQIFHGKVQLPEGRELKTIGFFDYIKTSQLLFVSFVLAVSYEVYLYIRLHGENNKTTKVSSLAILRTTLFFLSICLFMGGMVISGRFNDFFIFCASFYVVITISELCKNIQFDTVTLKKSLFVSAVVISLYLFTANILFLQESIAENTSPTLFEGVGTWLSQNTKKGDIIYDADWSWFPQLYYYSPDNNYVVGLEPQFTYAYSHPLFWLWFNISMNGIACEQEKCTDLKNLRIQMLEKKTTKELWYKTNGDAVAKALVNDFKTHYIITSPLFYGLNETLDNNKHFQKVYTDPRDLYIYKIID